MISEKYVFYIRLIQFSDSWSIISVSGQQNFAPN